MSSIGVELDGVLAKFQADKGDFDNMKKTMRRRAQKAKEMQENVYQIIFFFYIYFCQNNFFFIQR